MAPLEPLIENLKHTHVQQRDSGGETALPCLSPHSYPERRGAAAAADGLHPGSLLYTVA